MAWLGGAGLSANGPFSGVSLAPPSEDLATATGEATASTTATRTATRTERLSCTGAAVETHWRCLMCVVHGVFFRFQRLFLTFPLIFRLLPELGLANTKQAVVEK
jgi:hypothetical protein